ncbi:MAG: hypothetical protein K2O65_05605 [Lachnospiraceae bacterium]|nr:hypothetical protein [Lachnospiraceae bacterium]
MLKVKFIDQNDFVTIDGYMLTRTIVSLAFQDAEESKENNNGFIIYNEQGEEIVDCSEYKYRWDKFENDPFKIFYTNVEGNVQTEPFPKGEVAEPLSNEALTECVADLMYEVSLMQLGMGGE